MPQNDFKNIPRKCCTKQEIIVFEFNGNIHDLCVSNRQFEKKAK